jgi:long-chain acyl-CoA synthetase
VDAVVATAGTGGTQRREGAGRVPQQAWSHLLSVEPADEPAFAELQKPKRLVAALAFIVVKALLVLMRLFMRIDITGRDHLPASGPFLLSPNHQSYLDALLLVAALPFRTFRDVFFVGASEYFATPVTGYLARKFNIVPVDPDANLVKAMQAGAFGLRRGKVLILFPEGERSIDGTVRVFKKGAAILSVHLGAPIVPVAIDGLYEVWPRKRPFAWGTLAPWRRHTLSLRFGPPMTAGQPSPAGARVEDEYAAGTARLRDAVEGMWNDLHTRRQPMAHSS